jgi:hypothetical protein
MERRQVQMAHQMSVEKETAQAQSQAYEPLLPAEKQLIIWSLVIGVVLLGILIVVSYTFFPGSF